MKIRLGIPIGNGSLFPKTKTMIENLYRVGNDLTIEPVIVPGCSPTTGRNIALTLGQGLRKPILDFDYYLSCDNDVSFTISDIQILLSHDFPICGIPYLSRLYKNRFCGGFWKDDRSGVIAESTHLTENTRGLVRVLWAGLGALLIKKKVFEELDYPYFRETYMMIDKFCWPISDDIQFAMDLEMRNIPIFLDCNLRADHEFNR